MRIKIVESLSCRRKLKFDQRRFQQVLLNLFTNAFKYSKEGVIIVNSDILKNDGILYLRVSVADQGIGLVKEEMKKIFMPFGLLGNARTSKQCGNSHGIGLSVCK